MENRFINIGYQEYKKKIFLPTTFLEKMLKRSTLMTNFLQERLIEIWAEVNFQGKLRSLKKIEEQILWHKSLIRI